MSTCSTRRQSTWVTFAGSGQGEAILDAERLGLTDGVTIAVPAGTEHNVVNTSEKEPLRPYTLVSSPEHADGTINRTRQDALADERRRHGQCAGGTGRGDASDRAGRHIAAKEPTVSPRHPEPSVMRGPEPEQDAPAAQGADSPTPIWISPRLRTALVIGAITLLVLAIWRAPGILAIVIGGLALALVLSFPVGWLSRGMPRGLAILVSLLFLIGLIAVGFAVLLPVTIDQLTGLIAAWPNTQADLNRILGDAARRIPHWGPTPEGAGGQPGWLREGVTNRIEAVAADLLRGLLGLASGAIGFVIQVVATVTIAIYLLLDAQALRDGIVHLAPPRYRRDAAELWDAFGISLSRYLGGVVVVAVVAGALSGVALWALGVPYPLLLGGWVAVCSLIPVFGTYLGVVPALPLALAQSPTTAALTILAYVAIQQVEDNVLTPRVQGETAHAPPAVILLAVLWTGMAFGPFWAVLAVPALVAARVVFDFFRARLRVRKDHSGGRPWRTSRAGGRV